MDEILDVVDENNEVLRQEKRSVIHRDQLRHRAVHIFVLNKDNELLIQKRSAIKDNYPGFWDSSCAGHVDAGESYEIAARREIKEELGIPALELVTLIDLPATAQTGWEFVRFYWMRNTHPIEFDTVEIEAVTHLPLQIVAQEIKTNSRLYTPSFKECFRLFLKHVKL